MKRFSGAAVAATLLLLAPAVASPSATAAAAVAADAPGADDAACLLQTVVQKQPSVVAVAVDDQLTTPLCEEGTPAAPGATLQGGEDGYFWANKNGDAGCSGASSAKTGVEVVAGPAWSFKDGTASLVSAHPCIDSDKAVYVLHRNGVLRKFSSTGSMLWANSANVGPAKGDTQFATGSPALMNGIVYAGSVDGYVTAARMSTGETLWRVQVAKSSSKDSWSLTAHAGLVLASMRDDTWKSWLPDFGGANQIVALSGTSGKVVWKWTVPNKKMIYNFLGSIVEGPLSVAFATSEGRPYRVRLCDGETIWEGELPEMGAGDEPDFSTGGLATAHNGKAYVTTNVHAAGTGTKAGVLSAYDLDTGRLLWSRRQPMEANNAPTIGALGPDGMRLSVVVAIGMNPALPMGVGPQPPSPLRSQVVAFDAETGESTGWKYSPPPREQLHAEGDDFPDHICLPDCWSNGAIDGSGTFYIGHMSGNLFAIRDLDGDGLINEASGEVEQHYGGRCYQGSPGVAPGMLVSTPCDGVHVWQPPTTK